jgi:hypothetical protein
MLPPVPCVVPIANARVYQITGMPASCDIDKIAVHVRRVPRMWLMMTACTCGSFFAKSSRYQCGSFRRPRRGRGAIACTIDDGTAAKVKAGMRTGAARGRSSALSDRKAALPKLETASA